VERGTSKRIASSIMVAIVIVALAAAAGWLYVRSSGALTKVTSADHTVIVLASTADDGAQVAGIVAVATQGGATLAFQDPLKTVTIAGTSYDKLRDAYPFGGAAAVAAALGAKSGDGSSWVEVSQDAWVAALEAERAKDASGTTGVMVTLPKALDVFDGNRLASFKEGTSTVPPADLPLLLRGAAYRPESARLTVANEVGRSALRAMGRRGGVAGIRTNLSPEALAGLLRRLAAQQQ
jgi:hypothetical protein